MQKSVQFSNSAYGQSASALNESVAQLDQSLISNSDQDMIKSSVLCYTRTNFLFLNIPTLTLCYLPGTNSRVKTESSLILFEIFGATL